MNRRIVWSVPALCALWALSGCVMPGKQETELINRYQRAVAARGAQPRDADEGLDSLRPTKGETGPKLRTEKIIDSKTIETTESFESLGTVQIPATAGEQAKECVRVQVTRTVKTTTYALDANTGELTPRVTVVEDQPRPDIVDRLPEDYREVEIHRVGKESAEASLIQSSRRFIRLGLQDAIARALANNLDIRVISYDPAIAREDMVRAASVFDFVLFGGMSLAKDENRRATTFSGDTTRLRQWRMGIGQTREADGQEHKTVTGATWSLEWAMDRTWDDSRFTQLRTRYEPTVVLQVTQPLLRGAWPEFNLAQLRIAGINSKISGEEFRARVEEVVTQVIVTYWTLCQARRDMVIQKELLRQTKRTFDRTLGRYALDATKTTIKQAEASVRIRQAALIRARKTIEDVQDSLARLLADAQINVLSKFEVLPTTPLVDEPVRIDATEQLLAALRNSPLLAQARLAIAAAKINIDVAKNQTLPSLNLTASAGVQGLGREIAESNDKLLTGDHASYSTGLLLDYPIGNRARLSDLRRRKIEHTQAIVVMQNAADQIAIAIYERVRQIGTTYEEMVAQRAAVEAARIQLQALDYAESLGTAELTPQFLQVKLQAQETLSNAQRAELQATVEYNNAIAELARTNGTVLELNRVKLAMPAVIEGRWPGDEAPAPAISP